MLLWQSIYTYVELLQCAFLLHDESLDLIMLGAEVEQGVGHLFFLLVARLPGRYEIVGLEQCALLRVGSANVETILVEHDGLALHDWLSLLKESNKQQARRYNHSQKTLPMAFICSST